MIPTFPKYVLIYVTDEESRTLEHWYVRVARWGVPAGRIEEGELPLDAARRELLERTGYEVDRYYLEDDGIEALDKDETGFKFKTKKEHLRKVAAPGVRGGYETKIRWK